MPTTAPTPVRPATPGPAPVLLDTHTFVWLLQGHERLGPAAREAIEAAGREQAGVLLAAISVWEIGMLVAKGRLTLDRDVAEWVRLALSLPGVNLAPLEPEIALGATRLPALLHGDPADRLIVATARHHGATLITDDTVILDYAAAGHVRAVRAGA
jgi:PIN domain nuclease of toxin-antitoxin system